MSESSDPNRQRSSDLAWYLEGLAEGGRRLRRRPINSSPFRVGRHPGLELIVESDSVSQEHAEISEIGGLLRVRDLGSTNGTFINGRRVTGAVVLLEGDVLHIADLEFIVGRAPRRELEDLIGRTTEVDLERLHTSRVSQVRRLREVIDHAQLEAVYQPIVSLTDATVLGYESLGRVNAEGLPKGALELFSIAASIGAEAELSRMFRSVGLEHSTTLPGNPKIFLNTHPAEFDSPGLVESLQALRETAPDVAIVVEIHEVALTEPNVIQSLRSRLSDLDIGLAYDDFGTGQARLVDVVEVPPDYLKFDISLIQGIDRLLSKQKMLESLIEMAVDLGIETTAEGIETTEEAEVCRQLGFQYGQGYLIGRPSRVEDVQSAD